MDNVRTLIRSMVREAFAERPYGIAYTGAMVEDPKERKKLLLACKLHLRKMNYPEPFYWKVPSDYHMTVWLGGVATS